MTHARVRTGMMNRIIGAGGLALLGAILLSVTSAFAQSATITLDAYLHGSGGTANPPTLTADLIPPLSLTAKTKDSAGLAFSGGNPWATIGSWTPPAGINGKVTLTALTNARLWLGFKSSGDVGGKIDVLVDVLVNGQVLSSGLTRCVSTLTASASTAQDISIALGSIPTTQLDTLTQTLAVRVSARMGTTASNAACGTKASVTGVRAFFDALTRASRVGVTIALPPPQPVVLLPNPKTIQAGSTSPILALLFPVPLQATTLSVVSTATNVATVPSSVAVGIGQAVGSIPVTGVSAGTAQIKVTLNGKTITGTVRVVGGTATISSLAPSALSITQGGSGQLTVSLNATQATNTVVALSSSAGSIAAVPATVTVPAGQVSASFNVVANTAGQADITATLNGTSASSHITVTPALPTVVSLTPPASQLTLGATSPLTVTISAAQVGPTVVTLTSTPSGLVTVPPSVIIPAGQTTASFTVTSVALGTAMVRATLGSSLAEAAIDVVPPVVALVDFQPASQSLVVGAIGTLTITLNAAQSSPTDIALSVDQPTVLQIPVTQSVTVPPNQTQATFTVTALATGTAQLTATLGAISKQATVTVTPQPPQVLSVTPSPLAVVQGATGMLTVTLNAAQATDTVVPITTNNAMVVGVPVSVTVPAGLTTAPVSVSGLTIGTATVTATLNGTATASVNIVPPPPVVTALGPIPPVTAPLTLAKGRTGVLQVTINRAPTDPTVITLQNSATSVVTVPPSVTVPAGQLTASFPVTTQTEGQATITASFNSTSATAQVVVTAPEVESLTLDPAAPTAFVEEAIAFTATGLFTDGSSQPLANDIAWSSTNQTVASISTTGIASALAVGTTTIKATVTTSVGTVTGETTLTVQPAPVLVVTPLTTSLTVGQSALFTVGTSVAPASALTVTLAISGSGTALLSPVSVVISAGQTTSPTPVQVTATGIGSVILTATAPVRQPASSTLTITAGLPVITSVSPASGVVGSVVTLSGSSFNPVAVNNQVRFGGVLATVLSVSTTGSSLTTAVPAGALTGPVTVTTPLGTATSPLPFTLFNSAPVLSPIGNKTLSLGSTLAFTVSGVDPNGQPVTYSAQQAAPASPTLPAHMTFNGQTGVFTFTPDATQVGTFNLVFVASDGSVSSSETIALTVTGAVPGAPTSLSGRVDDSSGNPVVGVAVSLRDVPTTTTTNTAGEFTLAFAGHPAGRQLLVVTGLPAGYANLVAPVDLIANTANVLPTPVTTPPLDLATAVTVNPVATTTLTSATAHVTVVIPPGRAKNADGTPFTGQLTISPVPEYGRPESRPVELRPGLSVTIQPAGVILDPPVPITFPNVDNMPPGNEFDLWSLYPDTGTFLVVGRMRVSADGATVEMIPGTGGVRKTAWHFAMPPESRGDVAEVPSKDGDCVACRTGSEADLTAGALALDEIIPGIRTLGVTRDLALHYRSTNADVQRIVPMNATLRVQAAVPTTFSARLSIGGVQLGQDRYWDSRALPENADSVSRLGVQFDGSALPTGLYPSELLLFSNYPQSSIGGVTRSQVLLRNEQASPFGAGWTLTALDRLYPQADGSVVLAKGTGSTLLYGAAGRPLVVESFDQARSLTVSGVNASFVAGAMHAAARADLLNTANFGALGTVRRPVTFRSGLNVVTLPALAGVDVFVVNLLTTELTATEVQVLEQFVREGGTVLEIRNTAVTRPLLLGTLPAPFIGDLTADVTPEGLTSPLGNGPFGTIISPLLTGGNAGYATAGLATVLARNDLSPNVLLLPPGTVFSGAGRAVLIGDEEIVASGYTGGAGSNRYTEGSNRTFFLNAIAYLAGAPGYRPVLPAGPTAITLQGPPDEYAVVVRQVDGTYTRTTKDGTVSQFSPQGLCTSLRDRNGNQTTYAYDGSGRLVTITDPTGQVTTLAYSGTTVQSITDPAGRVTQLEYDAAGNLQRLRGADGTAVTFAYDAQHRLIRRTDARNQVTQYTYDASGRFAQATSPDGATRAVTPSHTIAVPNFAAGQGTAGNPAPVSATSVNRATFTDATNHTTTFELDALSRITKQTDALNRVTTITRDARGNPTQIVRPNGAVTAMTYDANGNLLTSTEQAIAATTTFTYEPTFNQVTSIRDPKGNLTQIAYDAKGNPLTITDALNQVTTFTYNPQGLLLNTQDALNQTTTFTYDALGRLLTTTDPLNRTTTLTYDAAGNVATSKDALNRITTFVYDAKNRLTQVTDPNTGVTAYAYDGTGNLLTVTDAKNQMTTFAYDSRNRLLSTTDPLGKIERYTYDGNDNLLTRITPKNETISFAYDAVNQLLSKTLPGSQVTSYLYDLAGNLTTVMDPDSVLTMTYDQAKRLLNVTTAGSPHQPTVSLGYAYDANGNRLTLADGIKTTSYHYDGLNRLTGLGDGVTLPPPTASLVAWWTGDGTAADAQGTNSGILRNGVAFAAGLAGQAFQFDGVDDEIGFTSTVGRFGFQATVDLWIKTTSTRRETIMSDRLTCTVTSPANAASWELQLQPNGTASVAVAGPDAGAGTTFVSGGVATTQRVNDGQWHRLGVVRNGTELRLYRDGQLEGFWNFLNGPPLLTSLPAGGLRIGSGGCGTSPFTGQLDEITMADRAWTVAELQAPRTQEQPVASYVYDALSRRIATTLSNGTQTTYSYDPASQVTNILHQLTASSTQINKADYLYNGVGNRTSLTDRRGSQTFGYDNLDRLTSASHPMLATPQSFAYDPVGNRTTNNSTVNAGNQLTADATHAYQYDDNGNLTRKTLLATGNYTQYTYDAENRLTKVEDFAAGNATPAFTSTYRYDGLGRRIEKIANGQTKRYIYDGDDILLEYDGSNVLQARYNHGPGIDEPIAVTKAGSTFFYHQDALGSVTDLTDSAGVTAKSYAYDAYGNILDSPGTVEQPFTYTGREFDAESGLYYYRARNYDPMTGRFLQADPFGIAAGVNLYSYVNNDPLNLIDPSGLSPVGWIVKLGDKCMKKVKALFSDEEMRQARKQGENVLVNGTRQKAHQVENGASNGSTIVKHSGHDFGGGARGRPHFQTPGRSGHTFWSGAAAAIGSLIDPFDASATAGREDDMIIPACDKCEVED
jgi:RHS repeat-associated protein